MKTWRALGTLVLTLVALASPALGQDAPKGVEAAKVKITVASDPGGASVFVRYATDGKQAQERYLGKTSPKVPLELKLAAGAAELVIFKDGYICKVEPLQLRAGATARLEVRLSKDVAIPHRLTLKGSANFVRSIRQSKELYVSVLASVVRFFVEEKDPRKLIDGSVASMVEVLNAIRSRERLLRRELSPDARKRYYGEELDLREYPPLVLKRGPVVNNRRSFTLGAGPIAIKGETQEDDLDSYLNMLWKAHAFLRKKWDRRRILSDAVLTRLAIEGQLGALGDEHTHFLPPDAVAEMLTETTGTFGGVGIVVARKDGRLTVIAPMVGTPAQEAGILAGDWIAAVDGKTTTRMTMKQCVELMRGPVDTPVELTIRRGKKELAVTILRARIKIRQTISHMLTDDVGYLRITSFMQENLHQEVARLVRDLKKQGAKALVIDLRNNPGGLLPQAHQIANLFVPKGKIVSTRTRIPGEGRQLDADPNTVKFKLPLAVLINGGSASASEIVAGTLQEYKLATVIGTKSFGKGSVQRVLPLEPYKCALALTVATYHLPSGATPHKRGITPDITIKLTEAQKIKLSGVTNYKWDEALAKADPQLGKAVAVLQKKLGGDVVPTLPDDK